MKHAAMVQLSFSAAPCCVLLSPGGFKVQPSPEDMPRASFLLSAPTCPLIWRLCCRRFCWLAASSTPTVHFPYQSVVKVDLSTRQTAEWTAPDGCFVGEPLYVSRSQSSAHAAGDLPEESHISSSDHQQSPMADEDDGYVVTLMHDARNRRSSLVILDAKDPAAGPVATLNLKRALPFAFHCLWSAQYHGPC